MSRLSQLEAELKLLVVPCRAENSARFFKTGPGQYGEGDRFIGITVPELRRVAKLYPDLAFNDIEKLMFSEIHEFREIALYLLVYKYTSADQLMKKVIYDFYISHTKCVNNWDLVDCSAPYIVGAWLFDKNTGILKKLAESSNIWERRIAMVSTLYFIKQSKTYDTFVIADILINDKQDLIQKAVGWMLREVGKRCSEGELEDFLKSRYKTMPRTSLRYAIERFSTTKRLKYLKGEA